MVDPLKVLFVCGRNQRRSPITEWMFRGEAPAVAIVGQRAKPITDTQAQFETSLPAPGDSATPLVISPDLSSSLDKLAGAAIAWMPRISSSGFFRTNSKPPLSGAACRTGPS